MADTIFNSKKINPSFITHHSNFFYINHSWNYIFPSNTCCTCPTRLNDIEKDSLEYPENYPLVYKS